MKSRVLARVTQVGDDWAASAFQAERAFCTAHATSQDVAVEDLKAQVEEGLPIQARAWLRQFRGGEDAPNCPEGAIKLPIDLWVCKLVHQTCPIQAQVFIEEPERFFSGCLAPPERKKQIFDTVAQGKYDGFHHVPGRYLCVSCEREGKKPSLRYHYPWELANLEAYYPFVLGRDWPVVRRRLRNKITLSMVSTALCAYHCVQLLQQLDSAAAAELRVLEFELSW